MLSLHLLIVCIGFIEVTNMRQELTMITTRTVWVLPPKVRVAVVLLVLLTGLIQPISAQNIFQRFDSDLAGK